MTKLGFIGLGIMGMPMAQNLLKEGNELYLQSRSEVPQELLDAGGIKSDTAREVAQDVDIVFIMVPDTPDVEQVLFGEDGVDQGLSEGKIVVDMSSISPIQTKEFAEKINQKGCRYLDAPVSGGDVGAREGTLTIMVGGDEETFAKVKPYFDIMGKNVTLVGENGAGQTCKVANQIIVALTIEAVGEALVFASKAGADPARVRDALLGGFASSRILEVHGKRMLERNWQPGFRLELHKKDLNLALEGARQLKMALPTTALVQELANSCAAWDGGKEDHSSLVKAVERLSRHEIGRGHIE